QNTWIDLRERLDDLIPLHALVTAIRGEPPGPDIAERVRTIMPAVCPYRGLAFFREEDVPFFFGRDAAITTVAGMVARSQFVAVVGASGSSKSSVVRAGLIPRLRKDQCEPWEIVTLVPNDRPLYSLAAALTPLLEQEMSETDRLIEVGKHTEALA